MPSEITGVMLVPGVSRNKRLYTRDLIGKAVARARNRITTGDLPITMLTHHAAGDDSLRIVGHLTQVEQIDDGRARFAALLDDTPEAAGIRDRWANRSLNSVSIRGWWVGDTRSEYMGADIGHVTTGDDLEINGLDFTKDPGVPGALLDPPGTPAEAGGPSRHHITESIQIDAITEIAEPVEVDMPQAPAAEAATQAAANASYADPGYLPDHAKRLPVGTSEAAIATWQHLAEAENAAAYTGPQLKRIRERVTRALRGHGVTVDTERRWLIETAAPVDVVECFDYPDRAGTVSACITNGPVSVSVSSWCVDPAQLDAIARAAMDGACQALAALDPDADGDIDVPTGDSAPAETGGSATGTGPVAESVVQPTKKPKKRKTTESTSEQKEPTVGKSTEKTAATVAQAPPAVGAVVLTSEQFEQLLNRTVPTPAVPVAAPVAAPVTPAAAAETEEQRIERLVAERVAAKEAAQAPVETEEQRIERLAEERFRTRVQDKVAAGQITPQRKGVQRPTDENNTGSTSGDVNEYGLPVEWPNKPLHQFTPEERAKYVQTALTAHVLGDRA